jgi:signal peptidase I
VTDTAIQTEPAPSTLRAATAPRHGLSISVQWVTSVIVIAVFVMSFIVQAFVIPSDSMENTLLVGDYLLVDKIDYANGGIWSPLLPYTKIKRGDIVVFHYPVNPQLHFVKRVIGLPGDRVHLWRKQVFVNGEAVAEPYTIHRSSQFNFYRDDFPDTRYIDGNVDPHWWIQMRKLIEDHDLIVPEGNYFVLGDNRDDSLDSRYWGFVPKANIVGRPLLIYWSVKSDGEDLRQGRNATLRRVLGRVERVFQGTRWHRTMKVVH